MPTTNRFARQAACSALALTVALIAARATRADEPGHVTGVGGIFFTSKDPKALAAWYRDALGMEIQAWGGAALRTDAPGHPPAVAWNAFPDSTKYFAPSTRDFMIDLAVDDMDAIIARLKKHGVPILKQDDSDPSGRFAWIVDPDGTKIELWQPHK